MPPKTKACVRLQVREALLDLCYERGFPEVTLEALCGRAGIDEEAFASEYVDLEDCFAQIHQGEYERFNRQASHAREGMASWCDRVRATAYAMHRFAAEDKRVWKFVFVDVRTAGERPQLLLGEEIQDLINLIDEGREEPGAPDSLTRATAESVGGGIFNQIYTTVGQGSPLPSEREIVPPLMYSVVLPYLGPEVAKEELGIPPPPAPE